jgi:hypothetical protein
MENIPIQNKVEVIFMEKSSEKSLAEKKISEVLEDHIKRCDEPFELKQDLKEWAIAVVKELWKGRHITMKDAMSNEMRRYAGFDKPISLKQMMQGEDCICWFLIDRFELTEEELK